MAPRTLKRLQNPLDTARALAGAGRYKKARGVYRQALKLAPSRPEILSELGSVEAELGNHATARQLMEKAIAAAPSVAAFHFNLGELERQAERFPQAEASFRNAIEIDPRDGDALFGLGTVLLLQERPSEALPVLERALERAPRDPEVLNEIGNALSALKRFGEAAGVYRRALALRPEYAVCWVNLALCCFDHERYTESNEAFDRAASLGPIPDAFLWKRAQVQAQCALYDDATATVEAALAADPEVYQAHYIKGVIAQYEGRFDDAEAAFRDAIHLNPRCAEVYEKLSMMKRVALGDAPGLELILDDRDGASDIARAAAGFALYRIYDAAGDAPNAFRALQAANDIKKLMEPFDAAAQLAGIREIIDVFSGSFLEQHAGEGIAVETPIFILGMPRSGTTLTEQILASSPDVHAGGEQMVLQRCIQAMPDYPACLRDVGKDWAAGQAAAVLEHLTSRSAGERFVTDKTPANYRNVGLIAWLFPNARIIYCRRDPMDVGFSCYEQNFHKGLNYSNDFDDFVIAWRAHEEIMAHWQRVLPGRIFTQHYEELIANPRTGAKNLVEFCDLEWDDGFLDTTRVDRPIQTASFWQARQPINASSVGKWRRYESFLSSFARALGSS